MYWLATPASKSKSCDSTFAQFPIIGTDLQKNIKALHRNSVISLVISIVGLLWGSLGLAQNGIFTMSQVWNLPGPDRPNYWKRLARSVTFLLVLALGLATSTFLAAVIPAVRGGSMLLAVGGGAASAIVNFALYLFAFDVLTPAQIRLRQLAPGAAVAGIGWTILQALGGFVVGHYLKNDSSVYGLFGIVLGLFAWVYLITELTVYTAELNVVLAKHLWPRSIVQPPLTDADRRSIAAQALQNIRRPEQTVEVSFDGEPIRTPTSGPAMARSLRPRCLRLEHHKVQRPQEQDVERPHPNTDTPVKLVHFGHLWGSSGWGHGWRLG